VDDATARYMLIRMLNLVLLAFLLLQMRTAAAPQVAPTMTASTHPMQYLLSLPSSGEQSVRAVILTIDGKDRDFRAVH
jgi:hypothetical protein